MWGSGRDARALRGASRALPLLWALLCASCSALVDPDIDSLGRPPAACSVGEVRSCPCLNGTVGSQRCNEGGGFDRCMCILPPMAGSGNSGPGGGRR